MLYTPSVSPPALSCKMTLSTIHPCEWHQQDLDQAGRPILAFLTAFGVPLINKAAFISPLADETSLQVSILNYASLALDVAGRRIKIAWEENVSAHLDFDEELKLLHLYRLPNFCAANHAQEDSGLFGL